MGASSCLVKRPGYLYQLPWELEQAHARADLQRREAALHASEERNRAILNAIPDLMFLLDREGTYLDYHARNEEVLLKPPSEFLGKKHQTCSRRNSPKLSCAVSAMYFKPINRCSWNTSYPMSYGLPHF